MLSKGLPYLETKVRVKGEICREGSKVRVKGGRDLQRRGRWLMAECDFRVRKHCIYSWFFFKCWLVEPVRFGSIGFRLYKLKPNRIRIFFWFFNRLIQFFFRFGFFDFFSGFLNLISLSVFLFTPNSITKLYFLSLNLFLERQPQLLILWTKQSNSRIAILISIFSSS